MMPQCTQAKVIGLAVAWATILTLLAPDAGPVAAHSGGTPRLTSIAVGPYKLYAWTDPEPLRVGEVHVSLIVTEEVMDNAQRPEQPVADAAVTIEFILDSTTKSVTAVQEMILNDLYYDAATQLPTAGTWQVNITVAGPAGGGQAGFTAEVLPPRTINWILVGAGGALLLLLLLGMGLWSRVQTPAENTQRNTRRRRSPVGRSNQPATTSET